MSLLRGAGRGRALLRCLLAGAWVLVAYFLADKSAHGFGGGVFFPLIRSLFQSFLLVLGFAYMEMAWDGNSRPLVAMGLGARPGAAREFALGGAIGWGVAAAAMLVIALGGHVYVQLSGNAAAWRSTALQLLVLAATSLAAEIAFRGYPFQKLAQATSPWFAAFLAGIFFALLRREAPGATAAAMWVSGMAAFLLSAAYLRTRALWICWGMHFAWLAAVGVLFGQPLAGSRMIPGVIQTGADGPVWLTGGEFGPEASVVTLLFLWVAVVVLVRVTRSYLRDEPSSQPVKAVMAHAAADSPDSPNNPDRPVTEMPPVDTPPSDV